MPGFKSPTEFAPRCIADIRNGIFLEESAYDGPSPRADFARKHRYIFETLDPLGAGSDGIMLNIHTCSRPSVEFDVIKIHHGQDVIYRPGKQTWSPIVMKFYERQDIVVAENRYEGRRQIIRYSGQDAVASKIYDWWAKSMIDITTSLHGELADYRSDAVLMMLDGVGDPIWEYTLYNCWISKVEPGELDHSANDLAEISVTMHYDKAVENLAWKRE